MLAGLEGISGLSRGEAMSESESGEASGLLVSESSSMAGYGGGGVEAGEWGGEDGEARMSCGKVGERECCRRCLLGGQSGVVVEVSPARYSGGAVAVAVVGDRDGQAASRARRSRLCGAGRAVNVWGAASFTESCEF